MRRRRPSRGREFRLGRVRGELGSGRGAAGEAFGSPDRPARSAVTPPAGRDADPSKPTTSDRSPSGKSAECTRGLDRGAYPCSHEQMIPILVLGGLGAGLVALALRAPSWKRAEKAACARRGLKHRGGPGKADCGRSVEVKHWQSPVHAGAVRKEARKGRSEIISASGFTKGARAEARRLGIRLRRS